jgi:hypothetical protein
MKKIFLLFLSACLLSGLIAQTVYTNPNDVFGSKSFMFYGYDYTLLKIADGSRVGQDFTKFFPALSKLLVGEFNQKEFEIKFRKGKNNIPFNITPTETDNAHINNGKVVTQGPYRILPDSLTERVKRYQLPEKEGIGSVIVFQCFNREEKTITAFMIFFDISTRAILYSKEVESRDGNGYNYMGDWKKASLKAIPRLLELCTEDFNFYRKTQKQAGNK